MQWYRYRGRLAAALSLCLGSIIVFGVVTVRGEHALAPVQDSPHRRVEASAVARPILPRPPQSLQPGVPIRVRIPVLGVEGSVKGVGLNSKGEMTAPVGRDDLVWYKPGYLPGALGNAVIAGHSDYKGSEGIFYKLDKLSVGDTIDVLTASHVLTFAVSGKRTYKNGEAPPDIFGPSQEARLNLITCSGVWNAANKRYTERLVVTATFTAEKDRID
jgi:sortase A